MVLALSLVRVSYLKCPQRGIRKGGPDQQTPVNITFTSLESDILSGFPFSDPPLGDGECFV